MIRRILQLCILAAALHTFSTLEASAAEPALHRPCEFFAFDNGVGRDRGWSTEQQAELTAKLGYDGIGYSGMQDLDARFAACDANGQRAFSFYEAFQVDADPPVAAHVLENLPKLQGRDAVIWIHTHGDVTEEQAIAAFRSFADEARKHGVRVAIYPHAGNYIATSRHALRIADAVDRDNFGMSINLCHELKAGRADDLVALAKDSVDRLFLVSINGADRIEHPEQERDWSRLIQPLGQGDFDLRPFLSALNASGYKGPIGLQCYQVPGEPADHLKASIEAWGKIVEGLSRH